MKKKIMLIDPFYDDGLKGFPLGLAYVAGALRDKYDVSCLDLTARAYVEQRNPDEILNDELKRINPDIVGITSTAPTQRNAMKAAKIIKNYKNIPIIKGGANEAVGAESTLKNNPEIDYSVIGEGERTVVELVDAITQEKALEGLEGIVYRKDNKIINNGKRDLICDLDTLPKPARDLFYLDKRFDKYYSAEIFEGKKSTSIMTSRGCPYACTFCSSSKNWGNVRQRTADNVIEEIKDLYSQGYRGLMFEDDMSIANKKWFLEFANKLKQNGLNVEYSLQTRVDVFNKEGKQIAKALKDSGCKFMYFGIESGVQEILDKCNKNITLSEAKNAITLAKNEGIRTMASIQFGLPGEDLRNLSTVKETIRVLNEELQPNEVAVSYTSLYPGSPLAIEYGITPDMYEREIRDSNKEISRKTAHGGSKTIHPPGLKEKKSEIEKILKNNLKIDRFKIKTLYRT